MSQFRFIVIGILMLVLSFNNMANGQSLRCLNGPKSDFYQICPTYKSPKFYLPPSKPPIKKRNKLLMGVTGALFISSGALWISSKSNYNAYKEVKNDIVYTQNNFTDTDLKRYNDQRTALIDKAIRQRQLSQYLLLTGVGTSGITMIFYFNGNWRELPRLQ